MEHLIKNRGVIKRQLTMFCSYVHKISKSTPNRQTILELVKRLNHVESVLDKFNEVQLEIESADEYNDDDESFTEVSEFENKYYEVVALAELVIEDSGYYANAAAGSQSNAGGSIASINAPVQVQPAQFVKLPTITLPKFAGDIEHWLEFRDSFTSLIHTNTGISDIQKFHYLKGSLLGKAAEAIKALELSNENYKTAWDNLNARYNNPRVLIHNHIKSLFNMSAITKESSEKIRNLIDSVSKHLRSLSALTPPDTLWETLIVNLISTKLDPVSIRKWEQTKSDREIPTLDDLKQFLKNKADLLETLEVQQNHTRKIETKSIRSLVSNVISCFLCKGSHVLQQCDQFLKFNVQDRVAKVKELKLCLNCLRKGHFISECKSSLCQICKRKHNTLLHEQKAVEAQPNVESQPKIESNPVVSTFATNSNKVLLSTSLVHVLDNKGEIHTARVLLDPGSQSSFITQALYNNLKLPAHKTKVTVMGINQSLSETNLQCSIQVQSHYNNFVIKPNCFVVKCITGTLPNFVVDKSSLNIPQDIQLADPWFDEPYEIDILLGADCFWNIIKQGQLHLGSNLPVLQKTYLGWIVSGPITAATSSQTVLCNVNQLVDNQLLNQLNKFWELEQVSTENPLSVEERYCESHFVQNTKQDTSGRFVVTIPLKDNLNKLGETRDQAIKMFTNLEKRLESNPILKELYVAFMKEYADLGHMSEIKPNSNQEAAYYLPHHGVLKDDSITTKLRVVFNASSKSSSGYSLNDLQMVGPTIQRDLFSILLSFRKHTYAFSADVEKMYRQILITPDQRQAQHIFWRSSQNETLKEYQLNTVTYGTASAPFLAIRCLVELGNKCAENQPDISHIIKNDFYVDDLISGTDSIEEAQRICDQLTKILESGCFKLRKWISNEPRVLDDISKSDLHPRVLKLGTHESTKTLGILWSHHDDTFTLTITEPSLKVVTKRTILSDISQIFDPLGLLSPIIIVGKLLLQDLWKSQLSWDDPIEDNLKDQWISFRTNLVKLNSLKIPRRVIADRSVRLELHAFSDASMKAYGSCVYLRSINDKNEVMTYLLCSKTRVAPLKQVTIPRVELLGALTMARLVQQVMKSLNVTVHKLIFWTDSNIVLGWIRAAPSMLKPFMANRVAEIQELTADANWRHVPGHTNPADVLTRGDAPLSLISNTLWWHGPEFLSQGEASWPCTNQTQDCGELPELKKEKHCHLSTQDEPSIFNKYSSISKLQRIVAYCLRFKNNCLNKNRELGSLTTNELRSSIDTLTKIAQRETWVREYHLLSQGRSINPQSNISSLSPFMDTNNIIGVGGRLRNSKLNYNEKFPILLPGKHRLTQLIIEREHKKLLHLGLQGTLNAVREEYWPTLGRSVTKKIIRNCIKCFRTSPTHLNPIMGNLPKSRVTPSFPFYSVGVDYAGPINIKNHAGRGAKQIKSYICLFVCFSTKAIHLELVTELTTGAFLMCLRRFIARRGKPLHIYSDNGRNFVGADTELKRLYALICDNSPKIKETLAMEGVNWHFIPPRSPNFGGLWEAGVKSTKLILKKIVNTSLLTYEEMNTTLVQIESILNSRPLTPISSDPNDLRPLCPSHFLIGRPLIAMPDESLIDVPENRISRYQRSQKMFQGFWDRWKREYLKELQKRVKWKASCTNLKRGTMVVVQDDHSPPLDWKIGRIEEVHPGLDGVVRVVDVKTPTGRYKRAVSKIYPLPIED